MLAVMSKLSREERINRALDGRKQIYIVQRMNDMLNEKEQLTEVMFTRKKKGRADFTEKELAILSEILGQDITN